MKKTKFRSTCAIARSLDLFGDKWSLLILRDILLHKKSAFKEFLNSRKNSKSNILTNRLASLIESGYITKLSLKGTKKSAIYIASQESICALPLLIELYLFSIKGIPEDILDESQIEIKSQIYNDRELFISTKRQEYIEFSNQLKKISFENKLPSYKNK